MALSSGIKKTARLRRVAGQLLPAGIRILYIEGLRQSNHLSGFNNQLERQLENLIENLEPSIRKSFESAIEHGVPIILGTDAGALPDHFFGYTGHKELEIFVALGMSPEQAIAAATSSAASQLGLYDRGLLEKGLRADFLILNANPLSDIRATQDISAVFLLGKQLDRTAIIERLTQDLRN